MVSTALGDEGAAVGLANFTTDSLAAALGAIIAVWPAVAHYFGTVSPVSPLTTLLILPVLPTAIITGALAGGLGLIALPVAQAMGWLSWLFWSYILLIVKAFAAFPSLSAKVDSVGVNTIWIYYVVLATAIWLSKNWKQVTAWLKPNIDKSASFASRLPKKWLISPLLVIAILMSITAATMPDGNLHVSFLDIGQGDAILIHQGSQQILVDGGPSPRAITEELGRQMPFWDRTMDLVVLTHPDADHLAGLV